MKALTSYCSQSIVEGQGSSSPRVVVHVSDRPEFCFFLRYRNDKKPPTFGYSKWSKTRVFTQFMLCHQKTREILNGFPSFASFPPEISCMVVDLETVEPQAQQSEQTNESKFVRVAFQLQKSCNFGEQFLIVGDDPVLGSWDPSDALPMTWSDGHIWTAELDMPAGKSIQFKFILKGKGGNIVWQPGSDRIIQTWETLNRISVCEDWENAELQKIVEEDQLSQSNEEAQVDSEVSTSAEILDNPQEELESNVSKISSIEDTQIHEEEKPLAEPVEHINGNTDSISSSMEKPMAIVAENIGSSENRSKSTSRKKNKRNMIQRSEESAESSRNDNVIHDPEFNGNVAPLKNQERTVVEGSLFDFEGGPVLVPGLITPIVPTEETGPIEVEQRATIDAIDLTQPIVPTEAGPGEVEERATMDTPGLILPIVPTEEAGPGEVEERATMDAPSLILPIVTTEEADPGEVEERATVDAPGLIPPIVPTEEAGPGEVEEQVTMDTSIGAFETQEQNIPELTEEQESDDDTLATINDEPDDGTPQEISATTNNEPELVDNKHEELSHLASAMEDESNSQPHYEPLEETSLKLIMSSVIVLIHLPNFLLAWGRWIEELKVFHDDGC
ncbi:Immunoglobulin-like fold [Sesbania bispinosa]|nr:Immunoglobulin-like fold [Sesbania bispinosa]